MHSDPKIAQPLTCGLMKVGLSHFAEGKSLKESFVLRMKFSAKIPNFLKHRNDTETSKNMYGFDFGAFSYIPNISF